MVINLNEICLGKQYMKICSDTHAYFNRTGMTRCEYKIGDCHLNLYIDEDGIFKIKLESPLTITSYTLFIKYNQLTISLYKVGVGFTTLRINRRWLLNLHKVFVFIHKNVVRYEA